MNTKTKEALEVINYWKLIEFLNQKDFVFEKNGDNKYDKKKEKGMITHIHDIHSLNSITDITALIAEEDDRFKSFSEAETPLRDGEIQYCFAGVKRNDYVDYLAWHNKDISMNPEYSAPDNTFFAAFSFKTDLEGNYIKDSIQISPLLWAVWVWDKNGAFETRDFSLQVEEYGRSIKELDEDIQQNNEVEGCHISQFIERLFCNVVDTYVKPHFTYKKAVKKENIRLGAWSYRRFSSEKEMEKSSPYDYSTLFNSYIADDLELFGNALVSGRFGDGSEYEKRVIEYVLAASNMKKNEVLHTRQVISAKEDPGKMKAFFENVLDIKNAPIAKWPSRFMPALMQQVAVNLAICKDENDSIPIFSVNGPPGTGKTTLLKEIIANNIVERALLLAQYDDPDKAFDECSFSAGNEKNHAYSKFALHYYKLKNDRINDYGMVVASCNNAAVENITADLPKLSDLLGSLQSDSEKDNLDMITGLREVHDLFDPKKMDMEDYREENKAKTKPEPELYFTRYANALFHNEDSWGLISAPLGKRKNIRDYCTCVLQPFDKQYRGKEKREKNKEKYRNEKALFYRQYEKVKKLRNKLERNCEIEKGGCRGGYFCADCESLVYGRV